MNKHARREIRARFSSETVFTLISRALFLFLIYIPRRGN